MSEDTAFVLPPGGIYCYADSRLAPMFSTCHSRGHNARDFVAAVTVRADGTEVITLHCVDCTAEVAVIEKRIADTLVKCAQYLGLDLYARIDSRLATADAKYAPFVIALWDPAGFDLKVYHPDMPWHSVSDSSEPLIHLLAQGDDATTLELLLDSNWRFADAAQLLSELRWNMSWPESVNEIVVNWDYPFPGVDMTEDGIRLRLIPCDNDLTRINYGRGTLGTNSHYFRPVACASQHRFFDEGWVAFEVPTAPRPDPYFSKPRPETVGDLAGGLSDRSYAREVLEYGGRPPRESDSQDASEVTS
jgi:hypothetical protein